MNHPTQEDVSNHRALAVGQILQPASYRDRINQEIESMEQRTEQLKESLALLDANPDMEKLLDLMRKTGVHF